jgi:hypothetical protein
VLHLLLLLTPLAHVLLVLPLNYHACGAADVVAASALYCGVFCYRCCYVQECLIATVTVIILHCLHYLGSASAAMCNVIDSSAAIVQFNAMFVYTMICTVIYSWLDIFIQ